MDTTSELLKNYKDLRDLIAACGPNDRLLARLHLCEVELLARQVEQDYVMLKSVYPDPVELLELAKPLSSAGRRNLDKAAALSVEIEKLLAARQKGQKNRKH